MFHVWWLFPQLYSELLKGRLRVALLKHGTTWVVPNDAELLKEGYGGRIWVEIC